MSTVGRGEFDLLRYMQLSCVKDDAQLSREESKMLSAQRHREIDESQYVSHCLYDKVKRVRAQFNVHGRMRKPNSYTRDASDKYGLFWFGQGKYDDDDDDDDDKVVVGDQTAKRRQDKTRNLDKTGVTSVTNVPSEERFKVWRPIEGPPLQRREGVNRETPISVDAQKQQQVKKGISSTVGKRKCVLTPPWAEHYKTEDSNAGSYTNCVDERQHDLFESGFLPRGVGGIDDVLRLARNAQDLVITLQEWRMREERQQDQHLLKGALDDQVADKRKRQLKQYEEDLVQIYGPTMRHILEDTFGQQPHPSFAPCSSNDGHSAKDDDVSGNVTVPHRKESPPRQFRARMDTAEMRLRQSRRAWLAAWEDHKRSLASLAHANTPCDGSGSGGGNIPGSLDMTPYSFSSSPLSLQQWGGGVAGLNRSSSLRS